MSGRSEDPDEIVSRLLSAPNNRGLCILDSCGVGKSGANRLIAGLDPVHTVKFAGGDPQHTLEEFEDLISTDELASIFTMSYDFGNALHRIRTEKESPCYEPDVFVAQFDSLLVHDFERGITEIAGTSRTEKMAELISGPEPIEEYFPTLPETTSSFRSNLSRADYIGLVNEVKELIRAGQTYQTNLTQRLTVELPDGSSSASIFDSLRRRNPAPFTAYVDRGDSFVISSSPESFFSVEQTPFGRQIAAFPIKGTRPRGPTPAEDRQLRNELANSQKDRAENTMIVDLMRNDIGRICEFGTVTVAGLCSVEEHPTLFQMVSAVQGQLRDDVGYADIIRALFPCGSITGAPKLRTMEIIDTLEPQPRGLSMGSIGCRIPRSFSASGEIFEASVAIRTMVIRDRSAVFNVGGGIVIDSDPNSEYAESMLKAKALLEALGVPAAL